MKYNMPIEFHDRRNKENYKERKGETMTNLEKLEKIKSSYIDSLEGEDTVANQTIKLHALTTIYQLIDYEKPRDRGNLSWIAQNTENRKKS